jgi:hypothetical protein
MRYVARGHFGCLPGASRLTDVQAYNASNVLQSHEHYVYDVFDRMIRRQVDATGGT